jgi:hypothetical protein
VKEERKSYRSCRLHHFSAGGVYLICTIQTLCVFYISPATAGPKFMSQGLIEVSLSLVPPFRVHFFFLFWSKWIKNQKRCIYKIKLFV